MYCKNHGCQGVVVMKLLLVFLSTPRNALDNQGVLTTYQYLIIKKQQLGLPEPSSKLTPANGWGGVIGVCQRGPVLMHFATHPTICFSMVVVYQPL